MTIFESFLNYLQTKNLPIEDKTDVLIGFKYNNISYLFIYDGDDINYFRLIIPVIYENTNDTAEDFQFYKLVFETMGKYKLVKAFSIDNKLYLSVELVLSDFELSFSIYDRSITSLSYVYNKLMTTYNSSNYGKR